MLVTVFASVMLTANAQKIVNNKITYNKGAVSIVQFAPGIYKISYLPGDYNRNENITHAVILKPHRIDASILKVNGDTLSLENLKITGVFDNEPYRGFSILLDQDEKVYGGGERALPLNRRGYRLALYNNPWYGYGEGADNLNFSVPFFTSSKGYGLFFDNASRGFADIGKTNPQLLQAGFMSGELNIIVIFGKTNQQILSSYYQLTGTQPLPPRWVMGNFMSRFGYTSEAQVKSIAARMNTEKIPFDAVIFDLFWFGDSIKGTLGNLDWVNTTHWPDPKKMMADFKKQDIHTILITEPFFLQNTHTYAASMPYLATDSMGKPYIIPDFYFGLGGLLDIFRKDAQQWIWSLHYKKQIENGVGGWWTDLGEPEKHPATMMHNLKDEGIHRLLSADEIHNVFGHYWNQNLFEQYAKDYPDQRLFHLNRSGFAGSQRYSIFPWSGDVSRSWGGLRAQLPVMLGMSMSGIPYTHADAGGFAGGEGDKELYVRWLQFASFTPIFRPHGTALYQVDPNTFSFPSEPALMEEPYKQAAKQIVLQRYAMLPYNYTLCYKQAKLGEPLVRPLYYQFANDSIAATIEKEFMWGDQILVTPVLEKGVSQIRVYLPHQKWYNPVDHNIYNGGQWIDQSVNLFTIPYYIREGSFIPQYAGIGNTKAIANGNLKVLFVPSWNPSSYELYEDDGESKQAISKGRFLMTRFSSPGKDANGITINIDTRKGNAQMVVPRRTLDLELPLEKTPKTILVNGKVCPIQAVLVEGTATYQAEDQLLQIRTVDRGGSLKIEIRL